MAVALACPNIQKIRSLSLYTARPLIQCPGGSVVRTGLHPHLEYPFFAGKILHGLNQAAPDTAPSVCDGNLDLIEEQHGAGFVYTIEKIAESEADGDTSMGGSDQDIGG